MTKKEMYQKMDEAFKEGITTVNITFNGEKFYFEINGECYCFDCIKNYYTKRVDDYI